MSGLAPAELAEDRRNPALGKTRGVHGGDGATTSPSGPVRKERPEAATVRRVGSGSECEPDFRTWVCPKDNTQLQVRRKCEDERGCPVCSKVWAWHQALEVQDRLLYVGRVHGRIRGLRHVVVSEGEPEGPSTREALSKAYARTWDVLRRCGFVGGVLVYHPDRHEGAAEWWSGPHFHGLLWGWYDPERRPRGVVVKVLPGEADDAPRAAKAAGGVPPRSLAGTLAYILNHAGYAPRAHVARYYGVASYNRTSSAPWARERGGAPSCPICGGPMEPLEGIYDWTANRPERVGRSTEPPDWV